MKIILSVFRVLGAVLGYLYSRKLMMGGRLCWIHFYSGFMQRHFYSFGKNSLLSPNITFIGKERISIGNNSYICPHNCITAWSNSEYDKEQILITIGNGVQIGDSCHITAINKIVIGDGCLLGKRITITDNSHGEVNVSSIEKAPAKRKWFSKGEVIIGKNVWIGDKATILPGVHIGDNSIIGANSVVYTDLPQNSVYVNSGSKILKEI